MSLPDDCPLDPAEYMIAWRAGSRWIAYRHGDVDAGAYRLEHCCGCDRCLDALAELDPGAAERVRRQRAEAEAERVAVSWRRCRSGSMSRRRVGTSSSWSRRAGR